MFSIYYLQANHPDISKLQKIAQQFGGIPLQLNIAMCLYWLALRQRHKDLTARERVDLAMTDPWGLFANARANLQKLDLGSVGALGRQFDLMTVGQADAGPLLHDLPTILRQAKVGALIFWLTGKDDIYPMAAYHSGGSLRGLGPDTVSLYTVEYGEFEPIKLRNIRSLPADAIYGFPTPIVESRAALMRLVESVDPTEADAVDPPLVTTAPQPSAVRFASHAQMAVYENVCPEVIQIFKKRDVLTKSGTEI